MLNDRLAQLTDYPFQRLARLLDGAPAPKTNDILILSIGEPQHPAPALVAKSLESAKDLWGKYPPIAGTPEFRAAAAGWLQRRYGLPAGFLKPDKHILPVAGTREALYLAAQLVVPEKRKDRKPLVLIPNPFYQVYLGAAVMAGAEPYLVPATRDSGFLPDFAALPDEVLERTALAYLCSPANPQGAVAGKELLERTIGAARRFGFVLAADECYGEIYDRLPPTGALEIAAASQSLENILVFHSLSKRSSVPGLRSGFAAGPEDLIAGFNRLRSYGGATVPLPILSASTELWSDEAHVVENRQLYRAKIDLAEQILGGRFGFYRPAGGFFLWLDVGDGEKAAARLWSEAGLRVLPGAYLARDDGQAGNPGKNFIRVALVHDLATTERALLRLAQVLERTDG